MKLLTAVKRARKGLDTKRTHDRMVWETSMNTNDMLDLKIVDLEHRAAILRQELDAAWAERAYRVEYLGMTEAEKATLPELP